MANAHDKLASIKGKHSKRALVTFSIILGGLLIVPVLAGVISQTIVSVLLIALGITIIASYWAWPCVIVRLFDYWLLFSDKFAKFNSLILLVVVYIIVIVPCGIVLRIITTDPLQRKIDKTADSYYIDSLPPHTMKKPY